MTVAAAFRLSPSASPALQLWIDEMMLRYPLSAEDRSRILGLSSTLHTYATGRDIVSRGDKRTHTGLIIEGAAARYVQFPDGTRQFSALYTVGDVIGLRSLVVAEAAASIQALELTRVVMIATADLRRLATAAPTLRAALIACRMIEEQTAIAWLVNLGHNQGTGRIAHLLCELACRHSRRGEWRETFRLTLTQAQMGEAVGLTAVHVNRKLRELRELGAVTITDGRVAILDWPLLCQIANFDPSYLYEQQDSKTQLNWISPSPEGVAA